MKIGTKSVLYGAHCFLFHWIFVAMGWWKLYGLRRVEIGKKVVHAEGIPHGIGLHVYASILNYKLWVAFFVHDLGYIGKSDMDGETEGETHPEWACQKMNQWFGAPWGQFVLTHSRFYAKKMKLPVSPLCYADKLAITMQPAWLYLPSVRLTGEIKEYMKMARVNSNGKVLALQCPACKSENVRDIVAYDTPALECVDCKHWGTLDWGFRQPTLRESEERWYSEMQAYVVKWVDEHKDGKDDTWTTDRTSTESGVWQ